LAIAARVIAHDHVRAPKGGELVIPLAPVEQVFPTLTPAQMARVAAHGSVRPVRNGEVLIAAGDPVESLFDRDDGTVIAVSMHALTALRDGAP